MSKKWFRGLTMLAAFLVLVAGIQLYPAKTNAASDTQVTMLSIHETDDFKLSAMNSYFIGPYTVTNEAGTDYVSFTIKNSNIVTSFQTEQAGVLVDAEVVSTDTAANTRLVKFPVADFTGVIKARVHISTFSGSTPYEKDHNIRLIFNNTLNRTALDAINNTAETKLAAEKNSGEASLYPEAAITALSDAIASAHSKGNWFSTQTLVDEATTELTAAYGAFEDAKRTAVPMLALHATDDFKLSAMNSYFLAPYILSNEAGTDYVSFRVKDSSIVTSFKTEVGGVLTDTTVVSTNETANTRVVKFPVADLGDVLNAHVHISMPGYDADHDIRIIFNNTLNRTALDAINKTAEDKLSAEKKLGAASYYPQEAITALGDAIASAHAKGHWFSTQALVDEARTELTAAYNAFEDTKLPSVSVLTLQDTDNYKLSAMSSYFLAPFTIENEGGINVVSFRIKDSSIVSSFKTEQAGVLTEAETVSTDTAANTRVVKFPVADLSAVLNASVHISTTSNGAPYEKDYNIRLMFNNPLNRTALDTLVTSAEAKLKNAVVGNVAGQYPQSAKTALTNAVAAAKEKGSWLGTQTLVDEAAAELTAAIATFDQAVVGQAPGGTTPPVDPNAIPDGTYSIDYTILREGTAGASVMNGYTVHPATLVANNGVYTITLRLTQSNEITGFKVNGVTPILDASNPEKNTRDVKFTVSDLTQTLNGWVKIDWDAYSYHEDYNIQIVFGSHYAYTEPGYESNPSIPSNTDDEDTEEETTEPTTEQPAAFKDTQSHWANEAIKRAVELGIVNGYSDGTFKPNAVINRAEFTAMISRALKLKAPEGESSLSFTDLSSIPEWAKPFIEQAAAAGIISGYADESFRPAQQISRTEIAVMVVKALGLPLEPAASLNFADANSVPEYAKAAVATAVKYGLLQGKGNNKFDPLANATRAEALTLILRALDFAAAQAAGAGQEAAQ